MYNTQILGENGGWKKSLFKKKIAFEFHSFRISLNNFICQLTSCTCIYGNAIIIDND